MILNLSMGTSCNDAKIRRQKRGPGFGLMNCKGIIEKYRKTNAVVERSLFLDQACVLGKGSRFYFGYFPKGVKELFLLCYIRHQYFRVGVAVR